MTTGSTICTVWAFLSFYWFLYVFLYVLWSSIGPATLFGLSADTEQIINCILQLYNVFLIAMDVLNTRQILLERMSFVCQSYPRKAFVKWFDWVHDKNSDSYPCRGRIAGYLINANLTGWFGPGFGKTHWELARKPQREPELRQILEESSHGFAIFLRWVYRISRRVPTYLRTSDSRYASVSLRTDALNGCSAVADAVVLPNNHYFSRQLQVVRGN